MNLLLDTHALLWWFEDSRRLGRHAKATIADPTSTVWVSAASIWEIAIKAALGRLRFREPPETCIPRAMARDGLRGLAISLDHAFAVRALPHHHGDPFDRLMIAQASLDGLTIVTADAAFAAYHVAVLDAAR